jgi:hypothetical protein
MRLAQVEEHLGDCSTLPQAARQSGLLALLDLGQTPLYRGVEGSKKGCIPAFVPTHGDLLGEQAGSVGMVDILGLHVEGAVADEAAEHRDFGKSVDKARYILYCHQGLALGRAIVARGTSDPVNVVPERMVDASVAGQKAPWATGNLATQSPFRPCSTAWTVSHGSLVIYSYGNWDSIPHQPVSASDGLAV